MNLLHLIFGKPVPSLNAVELNEKLKNGKRPLVIDVRQPDEYRNGHIAGAKLIPLGELKQNLKKLPQNKEIVFVCASGNRSRSATRILVEAGYDAFNMQGGMHAWRRSRYPIKKGNSVL